MHIKKNMFTKTVLLFMLIFLLPTILIHVFYYPRYRTILYQNVTNESGLSLQSTKIALDTIFFDLIKIWNTVNQPEPMRLITRNSNNSDIIAFQKFLKQQHGISMAMHRSFILSRDKDVVYSDGGMFSWNYFTKYMLENTGIVIEDVEEQLLFVDNIQLIAAKGSPYLMMVFPLKKYWDVKERRFILLVNMQSFFDNGNPQSSGLKSNLALLTSDGVLLNQWNFSIRSKDSNALLETLHLPERNSSVSQTININNENYVVNAARSSHLDLIYIRVTSLELTAQVINALNSQVLIIMLAILFMEAVLLFLHLRYNYLPFLNIASILSDNDQTVEHEAPDSAPCLMNELEFIQSAIDKLISRSNAYKELYMSAPGFEKYPISFLHELTVAIDKFQIRKTDELIKRLCEDLSDISTPIYIKKALFLQVIYCFDNILKQNNMRSLELDKICHRIDDLATIDLILVIQMLFVQYRTVVLRIMESIDSEKLVAYVSEHYRDPEFSIRIMAELFCMNIPTISVNFKRLVGESFQDYVNNIKIDDAKKLLWESHYTIEQIAQLLGYSGASSFGRAFKKATGYTPRAYEQDLHTADK